MNTQRCPDHRDGEHIFDEMGQCYGSTCTAVEVMPPAKKPYAYAVYFPDQPTEMLVHDLDELCEDMTNREHTIKELFTK